MLALGAKGVAVLPDCLRKVPPRDDAVGPGGASCDVARGDALVRNHHVEIHPIVTEKFEEVRMKHGEVALGNGMSNGADASI